MLHGCFIFFFFQDKNLRNSASLLMLKIGNSTLNRTKSPKDLKTNNRLLYVFRYFHVILCNCGVSDLSPWVLKSHLQRSRELSGMCNVKKNMRPLQVAPPLAHMILAQGGEAVTCQAQNEARGGWVGGCKGI